MFSESYSGTYKDKVRWFAGVADNLVHVTLTSMDKDVIFYDYMEGIQGQKAFEKELSEMCEDYIERFLEPEPITDPYRLLMEYSIC